jgi:hypothetical protein
MLMTEGKTGPTRDDGRKILSRSFKMSQVGDNAKRLIGLVRCQHKTIFRRTKDRIVHGNQLLLGNLQIGMTSHSNKPSELRMVNDTMGNRNGITTKINSVESGGRPTTVI